MATPGFHPIKGGTETIVRNFSIELRRIGVHVDVMTFNMDQKYTPKWNGKIEKIDGINVFKVPALNWLPIEHSPRITLHVNLIPGRFTNLMKRYDIIHFHELDFSFPLFSFFVRRPKIFHLHGINVDFLRRYHLSRVILKHVADYYIAISRQLERDLIELGISKSRIIYLPNAVDVKLFRPQGEKEDDLILFVGRISFTKGLHVLLDSLRFLNRSVSLVIIGPAASLNY
jgi:glycosyltransferase involved in cell wall biosynthesis